MFRRSQQPLIQGRLTINKRHESRQQQILRHDEVVQIAEACSLNIFKLIESLFHA